MLFITLLAPKSIGFDAVKYLKNIKDKGDIKIRDVFFTFGRYDALVIFEAPNEKAAMNFVMRTSFSTQCIVETLIAVPAKEL